jgi:hypothetical protein
MLVLLVWMQDGSRTHHRHGFRPLFSTIRHIAKMN